MRTRSVGFQDLIELERCTSNIIENLFLNFDNNRGKADAVQGLEFHAYPTTIKDHFIVQAMGIIETKILIQAATVLDLPEGMTKEEAARFLAFRIIQIMAPHGWMEENQGVFDKDTPGIVRTIGFVKLSRR
jgi:hypothetical protein